jgi:uncharacterized NAD(P)/FAD-binding protein YdhS
VTGSAGSGDDHVLIVGGGFSGTLLAINLLRHDGPRVTLIERRGEQLARGVAYSAADESHLLNVRAGNMSAFPDDPGHFVRWLSECGEGDARSFVRRIRYGAYLHALLADVAARAGDRLRLKTADVVRVVDGDDGLIVTEADGASARYGRVVLALGNLPPHAPPGIDVAALPASLYCDDPWAAKIADGLGDDDEILLLGTGLTAIDAALLLDRQDFGGRITAMSRRGLSPRAHDDAQPPVVPEHAIPARRLSALVAHVRAEADRVGWRGAVDRLRPVTQMMWSGADAVTRQRFLRHLRPFWDVHRHRLAPPVAARIETMVAEGRLRFCAGKLVAVRSEDDALAVTIRARGHDKTTTWTYARVVNCTGPQGDLTRGREPLLGQLRDDGLIRADVARLGIDITPATNIVTRAGDAHPRLHAIGPMTRGAYWEVVAVPDIRVQCWNLARSIANAHWVGGEGL